MWKDLELFAGYTNRFNPTWVTFNPRKALLYKETLKYYTNSHDNTPDYSNYIDVSGPQLPDNRLCDFNLYYFLNIQRIKSRNPLYLQGFAVVTATTKKSNRVQIVMR